MLARVCYFFSSDAGRKSKASLLLRILAGRPDLCRVMPKWKPFVRSKKSKPVSVDEFVNTAVGTLAQLYQVDPQLVLHPVKMHPQPRKAVLEGRVRALARRERRLDVPNSFLKAIQPTLPKPKSFASLAEPQRALRELPQLGGRDAAGLIDAASNDDGDGVGAARKKTAYTRPRNEKRWAAEPLANKFPGKPVIDTYGYTRPPRPVRRGYGYGGYYGGYGDSGGYGGGGYGGGYGGGDYGGYGGGDYGGYGGYGGGGSTYAHLGMDSVSSRRRGGAEKPSRLTPTPAPYAWVLPIDARDWILPVLSNYSCEERFIVPAQAGALVKSAAASLAVGALKARKGAGSGASDAATAAQLVSTLTPESLASFFGSPMAPADIDAYVAMVTRASKGLPALAADLPFHITTHPDSHSAIAKSMQKRLEDDVALFPNLQNTNAEPVIIGIADQEAKSIVAGAANSAELLTAARERLQKLNAALVAMRGRDSQFVDRTLSLVTALANHVALPDELCKVDASFLATTSLFINDSAEVFAARGDQERDALAQRLKFALRRTAGQEAELWADYLISSLLSSQAVYDLQKVNPYFTTERIRAMMALVEAMLLHANRQGQINRSLQESTDLLALLARTEKTIAAGNVSDGAKSALIAGLLQKSITLGRHLTAGRYYIDDVADAAAAAVTPEEEFKDSAADDASADKIALALGLAHRARSAADDERAALALALAQGQGADKKSVGRADAPSCALTQKSRFDSELERLRVDTTDIVPMVDRLGALATRGGYGRSVRQRAGLELVSAAAAAAAGKNLAVRRYDPRFLVFEFTWNILLRKSQVTMVREFAGNIRAGKSIVKQMIMGAGKTTVVAPLLTLMLGDGKSLVMEVVPPALLEFSRSVMRSTFSSIMYKRVFTFSFDRSSEPSQAMLDKIHAAVLNSGVVISTPTSVKSVMLKLLEIKRTVSDPSLPRPPELEAQRDILTKLLHEFRSGVLLMDEVDLILHPLKSELNFPIGAKHDLDFNPMRWKLAMHIIDAIFYAENGVMPVDYRDSKRAYAILDSFAAAIRRGYDEKQLQSSPHVILLNEDYYDATLQPILCDWVLLWLEAHHIAGISADDMRAYITASGLHTAELTARVGENMTGKHIKALNLARDWLRSYTPHVLQKIDRVSFGLLSSEDLERAMIRDPYMPLTRAKLAIPFLGKDVPSESSEFAHPDVIIGLTYMAYRYEGLRYTDFLDIIENLRNSLVKEVGPHSKRPSALRYTRWVAEAGGRVRGQKMAEEIAASRVAHRRAEIVSGAASPVTPGTPVAGRSRSNSIACAGTPPAFSFSATVTEKTTSTTTTAAAPAATTLPAPTPAAGGASSMLARMRAHNAAGATTTSIPAPGPVTTTTTTTTTNTNISLQIAG